MSRDVMLISGTASGKTLVMLLPGIVAHMEHAVSHKAGLPPMLLVVVPFIALMLQVREDAQRMIDDVHAVQRGATQKRKAEGVPGGQETPMPVSHAMCIESSFDPADKTPATPTPVPLANTPPATITDGRPLQIPCGMCGYCCPAEPRDRVRATKLAAAVMSTATAEVPGFACCWNCKLWRPGRQGQCVWCLECDKGVRRPNRHRNCITRKDIVSGLPGSSAAPGSGTSQTGGAAASSVGQLATAALEVAAGAWEGR